MAKKQKKNKEEKFPLAEIREKLPSRLDSKLIPQIYSPPKKEEIVVQARKDFYTSEEISQSYCTVHDSYSNAQASAESQTQNPEHVELPETGLENPPATISKNELQKLLKRSALAEYRKEKGLDKLRDLIKNKIIEACSFERGLDMLVEYLKSKKKEKFDFLRRQDVLGHMLSEDIPHEDAVLNVSEIYQDITSDEIAWLSLARPLRGEWIFDRDAPFYYPPALVAMSVDGFSFAFGTIDEKFEDNEGEATAFKIGGITGIDTQTQHIPFNYDLEQAIKALVVLEIEDQDIFSKLWHNESITAAKRGDAMLIKTFLEQQKEKYNLQDRDLSSISIQQLIDDKKLSFSADSIEGIRKQITDYYYANNFRNDFLSNVFDFVKLIGLLKRVPKLIQEHKKFDGYVMFYGENVEFIDQQGNIESVPLLDYALHEVSFNIHAATASVSRKNKLVNQLFDELADRILDKNLKEGNMMAIDVVRKQIWDKYKIYIPLHITSEKKTYEKAEFFLKKLTDDEYIERTVKFGFNELVTMKELLGLMPQEFTRHVRSITKKQDPSFDIDTFRTGEIRGGCFNPETGRIELSLPIDPPVRFFKEKFEIDYPLIKEKERKEHVLKIFLKSELYNAMMQHTFLHELAESVYLPADAKWKDRWFEIESSIPKDIAGKENQYFLTQYAKKNPREDFCETFATYVLFGSEFRKLAKIHKDLELKYEFMKDFFSIDGKKREFDNRTGIRMELLHEDPRKTLEQIATESSVRDALEESEEDEIEERLLFAGEAMSYQDAEEVIRAHEADGIEISREEAAKILQKRELASEDAAEARRPRYISGRLQNKTLITLYHAGVLPDITFDFPKILHEKGEKETIEILVQKGATQEKAENCVKELSSLYSAFPEAHELMLQDIEMPPDFADIVKEITKYIKFSGKKEDEPEKGYTN